MRNNKCKKLRRKINRVIRMFNKSIERDSLWKGRFVLLNCSMYIKEYADHSGAWACVKLQAYDKKTGKSQKAIMSERDILGLNNRGGFPVWNFFNNFIVDYVKVWSETPSPRDKDFVVDYTKVPATKN